MKRNLLKIFLCLSLILVSGSALNVSASSDNEVMPLDLPFEV